MKIIAIAISGLVLLVSMINPIYVYGAVEYLFVNNCRFQANGTCELATLSSLPPDSSIDVIVEFKLPEFDNSSISEFMSRLLPLGFSQDVKFGAMSIKNETGEQTMIIHGNIDKSKLKELESVSGVVKVWKEGKEGIKPFFTESATNINLFLYYIDQI